MSTTMITNASKNNIGNKIPHFKVETNSSLLKIRMKNMTGTRWPQRCLIATVGLYCMILVTAGFKWNIHLAKIFLSVAEFQNGAIFFFPRWASELYSLQTGVLGNSVKYQSHSDFQLPIAGQAFFCPQTVQWHLLQRDTCTEARTAGGIVASKR